MITPNSLEEIASYVEQDGQESVCLFSRLVWGLPLPQAFFAGD